MRALLILLLATLCISCSDITNNVYVDKDGNVTTELSIEPHTFLPMDMMGEMMGDSSMNFGEAMESEVEGEDTSEEDKIFENIFKGITQLDTTMSLTGMDDFQKMKDSIPFDAFIQDIVMIYKGDTTEQTSNLSIRIDQNKDQYHGFLGFMNMMETEPELLEIMASDIDSRIDSPETFSEEMEVLMKKSGERSKIFWDKGVFTLSRLDFSKIQEFANAGEEEEESANPFGDLGGDFGGMSDDIDMDDEFTREMLTGMFGRLVTKVHLPGKVEFTNDTTAVIDGNTVTFSQSLIEMMMGDGSNGQDRIIKFKK